MTAAVVEAMVVLLISLVVAGYLCGVRPHLARRRQRTRKTYGSGRDCARTPSTSENGHIDRYENQTPF
jgi:hypothetical protein